jgi:hypothetical protein
MIFFRKNDHLVEDGLKLQLKTLCVAKVVLPAFLLAGEKRLSWHQDVLQPLHGQNTI